MNGLALLWMVFYLLPWAFLLDFVIFQTALRLKYAKDTRHGR